MAKSAKQIITVSHFSRQILDAADIAPLSKSSVIHNGVDHLTNIVADEGWFTATGLTTGSFAVHFASRKAYKNTQLILGAFADRRLAGMKLALVGDSPDTLSAAGMTVPSSAVYLGRVTDAQLKALYLHALCLLFPSRTEGFGLPPLEAMRVGCPAIVSPGGAIPEACKNGATYAAVDDPEEWIMEICRLLSDQRAQGERRAAGIAAASKLTWRAAGERLLGIVLSACSDQHRSTLATRVLK
jgi:glycosyltransferase involved in cell wall biosynthesis